MTYDVNVTAANSGGVTDITTSISLPRKDLAFFDLLGLFASGDLSTSVTMRQES